MDNLECEICCEEYNVETHRPKNLPCGHTFCSSCMEREITNGKRTCATCRKPHNAWSTSALPTSVTLERLIRDKQSNKRKKMESDSSEDEEDDNNGGRCTTHRKSYLYFHCLTHSKKICRECTIIDHRAGSCNIISFKQMVERERKNCIQKAERNVKFIKAMMTGLDGRVKYNNNIQSKQKSLIKDHENKIKIATSKIDQAREENSTARTLMNKEEVLKRSNDTAKLKLQNATTKKELDKVIIEIENVHEKVTNWKKNADQAFSSISKTYRDTNSDSDSNSNYDSDSSSNYGSDSDDYY